MAAAVNDVVRATVNQRQAGQLVQNVFWYQVVAITGLSGDYLTVVKDWIVDEIIDVIRPFQSTLLTYESMFLQNVTNGVDFLDFPFTPPLAGTVTGDVCPPQVTYTLRLIRETLATRNGYKRFAGVPEGKQNNGVYSGAAADWVDLCDALAADIQPAPSVIPLLAPVIVRRGPDGEILAVNNVGGADYRRIGSQNTRKIGRGA